MSNELQKLNEEADALANASVVVPDQQEVANVLLRFRCNGCSREVGMEGSRDDARGLLEHMGWRIGHELLCPGCVKERIRSFRRKYADAD